PPTSSCGTRCARRSGHAACCRERSSMSRPIEPSRGRQLRVELTKLRSAAGKLRADRHRVTDEVASINAELRALGQRIAVANAAGDRAAVEQQQRQHDELVSRREAAFKHGRALDANLRIELDRWRLRVDPCDADAVAPPLLLPVRIETRYLDD